LRVKNNHSSSEEFLTPGKFAKEQAWIDKSSNNKDTEKRSADASGKWENTAQIPQQMRDSPDTNQSHNTPEGGLSPEHDLSRTKNQSCLEIPTIINDSCTNKSYLFEEHRRSDQMGEASFTTETVFLEHKSETEVCEPDDPKLVPKDANSYMQILKGDGEFVDDTKLLQKTIMEQYEGLLVNGIFQYSCLKSKVGGRLRQTYPARFTDRNALRDFLSRAIELGSVIEAGAGGSKTLTLPPSENKISNIFTLSTRIPMSIQDIPSLKLVSKKSFHSIHKKLVIYYVPHYWRLLQSCTLVDWHKLKQTVNN